MNKDYKTVFTGTIIGGDTLVGHLLGHTLNARNFFGMEHGYFVSNQIGLDERFPDYVRKSAQSIDETFGPHQTYNYNANVPTHEPIVFKDKERNKYGPYWPNHNTNYGSFDNQFKQTDTIDDDEDNQIRIWMMNWDWMLRDAALTYLYKLKDVAIDANHSEEERDLNTARMEYIIYRLYDLHAEYEREQVEHYRKQTEVKQWLLDYLWEKGEITTDKPVYTMGNINYGKIRAKFQPHKGQCVYAYGDTMPEVINKLWGIVYELENR